MKKYKLVKTKLTINKSIFIVAVAVALFVVGMHNIDLIMNYSIIYNDLNHHYNLDLNVRDIQDCNVYGQCFSMQRIYMNGLACVTIAFATITFMLIHTIIAIHKKEKE